MVRETRHLWVGNLPDNIREEKIREHFKRYGRVQSVKILARSKEEVALGGSGVCATVSFMDIKSASKAHNVEQKLDERCLSTEYHEPAAIPSASPTIGSHLYPATARPYIHGSPLEELSSFERSSHFYDREREAGYRGRPPASGYHVVSPIQGSPDPLRNRTRDRTVFRAYTPLDSVVASSRSHHHRVGTWAYEANNPRYTHHITSCGSPDLTYPEDRRVEPPLIIVRNKQHLKPSESRGCSEDRSGSPSSSSSTASHSGASSSCSSSSSTSPIPQLPRSPSPGPALSDKSSSSQSHHGSSKSIVPSHVPGVVLPCIESPTPLSFEHQRHNAICIKNLPLRSSDTSLKDGLYHEYKRHGKVTCVKVVGQGCDRYALVFFKKTEDVEKALQVSHDKSFFGSKIEVSAYQGHKDVDDNESRPIETDVDEFHSKATRTLFIGNLNSNSIAADLRKTFETFGEIIEIDIKKGNNVNGSTTGTYAFVQYIDISSVVKAMRTMDGEFLAGSRINLGFGKSLATTCVWIDGVAESVSEKYLASHFNQFGSVTHCVIDRSREHALVFFQQITHAQLAVTQMRGSIMKGRKLQVDFASRECQQGFYEHLDKTSNESSPRFTSQQLDNTAQLSPGSTNGVAIRGFETPSSSCSSAAGEKSYPRNPDEQRGSLISVPTPQDIHNLQKERVSLLEQLEDCNSSGDELLLNDSSKTQQVTSPPGTPLCDERPPESLTPPTQVPSRSQLSISVPLPRFAVHVSNPLLSPPLSSSPRRPRSTNSDDSQTSDPSASGLEERLKNLDEKYEQWSDSRTNLLKLDSSVRLRSRYKLLDTVDKLEPSDIVKSVLAKPSVFDEDTKRLENFSDKYIPKEFVPSRTSPNFQNIRHQQLGSFSPLTPSSSGSSKSPPASSPAAIKTQYSFPSHPQSSAITQNCRTSPTDSRVNDHRLLIDSRASTDARLSADSRGSFLTKQNICTINDNRYVPDILNTKDPRHPIHKDAEIKDGPEAFYRSKIRDEYTKNWLHTFDRKDNEPSSSSSFRINDLYENRRFGDSRKDEDEKLKAEQIQKQKLLDGFIVKRKNSVETVTHSSPFFIGVQENQKNIDDLKKISEHKKVEEITKREERIEIKKVTEEIKPPEPPPTINNIDEEKKDFITNENTITNILLSVIDNFQKKPEHEETRVKVDRTVSNESVSKLSDTEKKKEVVINESIKKKENERKKSVDIDHTKAKDKKDHEPKKISNSKSKESESSKSKELEFNMFEINRINNKKKEELLMNGKIKDSEKKKDLQKTDKKIETKKEDKKKEIDKKDDVEKIKEKKKDKRDKDPPKHKERKKSLEENNKHKHENSKRTKENYKCKDDEKLIHQTPLIPDSDGKINDDKESKKDKRIDRNSISSNSSTGLLHNSSKRRMSDSSENLEDSKRLKTDNKNSKDKNHKKSNEKHISFISKILDGKNKEQKKDQHEKKAEKKKEDRKIIKTPSQTDTEDEDEDEEARERRKNHSIFEVVLDEPYISMYDKVKARSTKNMQKQEEEKRQEKLKEKFSQLKQSRAKREEKKRSTSYDGDSDSDRGHRRSSKLPISSSDDDDDYFRRKNQRPVSDSSENEKSKTQRNVPDSYENKVKTQRGSDTFENERLKAQRVVSDSSENEKCKQLQKYKSRLQTEYSDNDDHFVRKSSFTFDRVQNDVNTLEFNGHHKKKKEKKEKSEYSRKSNDINGSDNNHRPIKEKKKKLSISHKANINETMQDIFGSLTDDDNEKTNKWNVSEVFGTDSDDTEHERKENKPKMEVKKLNEFGKDVLKSLSHNVDEISRKKKKKKKDKERNKEDRKDERREDRKEERREERREVHLDNKEERKEIKKDEPHREDRKEDKKIEPLKDEKKEERKTELKEDRKEEIKNDRKEMKNERLMSMTHEERKVSKEMKSDRLFNITHEERKISKEMKNGRLINLTHEERKVPKESKHYEEIKVMDNLQSIIESKKKPKEFISNNVNAITPNRDDVFSSFFDFDDSKGPENETITIFKGDVDTAETEIMFRKIDEKKELLFRPINTFEPVREIIGFGSHMDDETAVKSISETPEPLVEETNPVEVTSPEEKSTPVISQEETEGAVAALLEASFGQDFCDSSYSDRSAKPDTPISDSELRIDTDDEDSTDSIIDECRINFPESSENLANLNKIDDEEVEKQDKKEIVCTEKTIEYDKPEDDLKSSENSQPPELPQELPTPELTDTKPQSPLSHNFRLPQMVIQQTSIRPFNINYTNKSLVEVKLPLTPSPQEIPEIVENISKLDTKIEDHVSVVKFLATQIPSLISQEQSVISCTPIVSFNPEFSQPSVLQHTKDTQITQSCIVGPPILPEIDKPSLDSKEEKVMEEQVVVNEPKLSEELHCNQAATITFAKKSIVHENNLAAENTLTTILNHEEPLSPAAIVPHFEAEDKIPQHQKAKGLERIVEQINEKIKAKASETALNLTKEPRMMPLKKALIAKDKDENRTEINVDILEVKSKLVEVESLEDLVVAPLTPKIDDKNENEVFASPGESSCEPQELDTARIKKDDEFTKDMSKIIDRDSSVRGRRRGGRGRGSRGAPTIVTPRRTRQNIITPNMPQQNTLTDVYEFTDEDEKVSQKYSKSPEPPATSVMPIVSSSPPVVALIASTSPLTRKSRRLQEKDGSKSTLEETIDEVARGPCTRRTTRNKSQSIPLLSLETSPRKNKQINGKKMKAESPQPVTKTETCETNSSNEQIDDKNQLSMSLSSTSSASSTSSETTTLIDPVSGLLIPMQESEEGQYVPINDRDDNNRRKRSLSNEPPEKKVRLETPVSPTSKNNSNIPALAVTPNNVLPATTTTYAAVVPGMSNVAKTSCVMTIANSTPVGLVKPNMPSITTSVISPTNVLKTTVVMSPSPPPLKNQPTTINSVPHPIISQQPICKPQSSTMPPPIKSHLNAVCRTPPLPKLLSPKGHIVQAYVSQSIDAVNQNSVLQPPPTPPIQPLQPLLVHVPSVMSPPQRGVLPSPSRGVLSPPRGLLSPPSRAIPLSPQPSPVVHNSSSAVPDIICPKGFDPSKMENSRCIVMRSPSPLVMSGQSMSFETISDSVPLNMVPAHHFLHHQLIYPHYLREPMANFIPPRNIKVVPEVEENISSPLELHKRLPDEHITDRLQLSGAQQYNMNVQQVPHPIGSLPFGQVVPINYGYRPINSVLKNYPIYWQGTLALKNDKALVEMHYLFGNAAVAEHSLQRNIDGELKLSQRMRLEQTQLDGVTRKMQIEDECCVLIAVPIGMSEEEWNQQSYILHNGFITYLQQKQAAGIINITAPGSPQNAYIVHMFPPCEYINSVLATVHPTMVKQIASMAHLIIVIATV